MSAPGDLRGFLTVWFGWCFAHQTLVVYPVYALMMEDAGVSPLGLGVLFALWTLTAAVLEVPSGALSDRYPRERVLAAGLGVKSLGFAAWWLQPSFGGFLVGFVLWGAGSALASGTREALLYERLARDGRSAEFGRHWSRSRALMTLGGMAGLAVGGYAAETGYAVPVLASVAVSAGTGLFALLAFRDRRGRDATSDAAWAGLLRAGLAEVRGSPPLRALILAIAATVGIVNAFEEFTSPVLRDSGASLTAVGLLFATLMIGQVCGELSASALTGTSHRTPLRWAFLCGAALLAAGMLPLAGTAAALTLGFFAWGVFGVSLDERLQQAMSGDARATVTSVASLGQTIVNQGTYLVLGAAAGLTDWRTATLCAGGALAVAALTLGRSISLRPV